LEAVALQQGPCFGKKESAMNAAVHVHQTTKYFGGPALPGWNIKSPRAVRNHFSVVRALDQISFDVNEGEIFGLVGSAGAGKSTLMRILATLLQPDEGEIRIFGYDIVRQKAQVQRLINQVSVKASFFKQLSPLENLLREARLNSAQSEDLPGQIVRMLSRLGFQERVVYQPMETISRSEQQLVAIARALLSRPRLLLLDHPTAGLDLFARYRVEQLIREHHRQHGATILFTSRDLMDAARLADRIAILHQGRLVAVGAPDVVYDQWAAGYYAADATPWQPEMKQLLALEETNT
jgi:ABC-2 type transport system ATP-binding protein